ncbi:MAG TPA: hypothetical protein VIW26_15760 [Gemmatimonadales bacterium]|jgi:hypothetical protein
MTDWNGLAWRTLPAPLRTLGRWVTLIQIVGYTTSLVFVWRTTSFTPPGIAARYRGVVDSAGSGPLGGSAGAGGAMQFPKSFAEMLTITHTHILGMAAIFAISGLCLALCTRPGERWRRFFIAEPFVALFVSFSSMWLMRYVDPRFAWLLEASSASLAVVFYLQSWWILRELGGGGGA